MAIAFALVSCGSKSTAEEKTCTFPLEMEKFAFEDSTKFADVDIKGVLPVAKDSVSQAMRDTLLAIIGHSVNYCDIGNISDETETTTVLAPYSGDTKDAKAVFDYYGKAAMKIVNKGALNDYNEMKRYEAEDTTRADAENPMPTVDETFQSWEFYIETSKIYEDSTYVVFNNQVETWYGGAHPNTTNDAITFRFSDGSRVTEWFKDGVTKAMQPLLKKGLKQYFKEGEQPVSSDEELFENLQLPDDNNIIPLPACPPSPDANGLVFTYQQYEIACYAVGMPSFTLTWEELKPFLK